MKCLALDIGSSTIKGAVLDIASQTIGPSIREDFPAPLSGLPPGHFEVDPLAVFNAVERVIRALLDTAPDCVSLYCSGQMGGVILVNDQGEPLTNYLSWRDQRTLARNASGQSYLDSIRQRWGDEILRDVGNELAPGSALSLMYWLACNNQLPARAMPATVADFVIGRLCHVLPQMHDTHALGLLDLHASTWHQEALGRVGLEHVRMPEPADAQQPVGRFSVGGHSVSCFASFGDQQCALRGAGLLGDELSLNISTGSQVSRRTARFEPGNFQTRKYFDGDFLNTITHLPAGRSLNTLVDLLTELARAEGISLDKVWQSIARSTQECESAGSGGLQVNLAFFAGPLGTSGSIDGITTENLRVGNLFHAAFQSMAHNYAVCAERLGMQDVKRIVLSGGLTQSFPVLRQLIQRRFPIPLRDSPLVEETLAGLLDVAVAHFRKN